MSPSEAINPWSWSSLICWYVISNFDPFVDLVSHYNCWSIDLLPYCFCGDSFFNVLISLSTDTRSDILICWYRFWSMYPSFNLLINYSNFLSVNLMDFIVILLSSVRYVDETLIFYCNSWSADLTLDLLIRFFICWSNF